MIRTYRARPALENILDLLALVCFIGALCAIMFASCGCDTVRTGFRDTTQRTLGSSHVIPVPAATETGAVIARFAQRAPEVFRWPDGRALTVADAEFFLRNVQVDYTEDVISFPGATPQPGYVITGWSYGQQCVVLIDETRTSAKNNALIHELVHALLWGVYRDPAALHEADPSGLWTAQTTAWVNSVMAEF